MPLNLFNFIGFGTSALITLFISIYLIRKYYKSKEAALGYFTGFITVRFGLFLFFALANLLYLLSQNLFISAVLFLAGWIMVFISLAFPPFIFSYLKFQKRKNLYPGIIAGLGLMGIIISIARFTPASIDSKTGLALVAIAQLGVFLYIICKAFGVLPLSILFLSRIKKGEKWLRIRSLLLGLGLLWVVSTILIPTFLPGIWGGIYCSIGDILIFAGVLCRPPAKSLGNL